MTYAIKDRQLTKAEARFFAKDFTTIIDTAGTPWQITHSVEVAARLVVDGCNLEEKENGIFGNRGTQSNVYFGKSWQDVLDASRLTDDTFVEDLDSLEEYFPEETALIDAVRNA